MDSFKQSFSWFFKKICIYATTIAQVLYASKTVYPLHIKLSSSAIIFKQSEIQLLMAKCLTKTAIYSFFGIYFSLTEHTVNSGGSQSWVQLQSQQIGRSQGNTPPPPPFLLYLTCASLSASPVSFYLNFWSYSTIFPHAKRRSTPLR